MYDRVFVLNRQKELEMLMLIEDGKESSADANTGSNNVSSAGFSKLLEERRSNFELQVPLSVEAANSLMSKLRFQLEQFRVVTDETSPWEEKSMAVKLSNKLLKSRRNKLWRKRKRKCIAELMAKVIIFGICLRSKLSFDIFLMNLSSKIHNLVSMLWLW